MLVTTENSKVEYTAAASQTAFAIPFPFVPGDITAYVNNSLTSDYVITGTVTDGFYPTATLTFNTARTAGDTVLIRRKTARTQQTDYVDHDPFGAASHENALAKLTLIASDLYEITTRCLQLNIALSHGKSGLELPSPDGIPLSDANARLAIAWNALKTNLEAVEINGNAGLVTSALARSTFAGLPGAGTAGRARDVTDNIVGVHLDQGVQWWALNGSYADVRAGGARGNGSTDDRTVLNNIQSGLPAGVGMRFAGPYTYLINSNWTITANCQFHPGAKLKPASGVTITINDTADIEAGRYTIFDRSAGGSVVCQSGREVKGEWFGAVGDALTDSGAAIHAALNANTVGMHVTLGRGVFMIESTIDPPKGTERGWRLSGATMTSTILRRKTGFASVILRPGSGSPTTNNYEIDHLSIDGVDTTVAGVYGLYMFRAGNGHVHDMLIENCETGIYAAGSSYHRWVNLVVQNNKYATRVDNQDSAVFTHARIVDCRWRNNTEDALIFDSTVHASGQIRLISLQRCSFEAGGATSGGRRGLIINRCDQITCYDCWFEGNFKHFQFFGGDNSKSISRINFIGGNMGGAHASATDGILGTWSGAGSSDGLASKFDGVVFTEDEFQFTQSRPVKIVDCQVIGNATLTGSTKVFTFATSDESGNPIIHNVEGSLLDTTGLWFKERYRKVHATHTEIWDEALVTQETASTSAFTFATFTTQDGESLTVTAEVTACIATANSGATYHQKGMFQHVSGTLHTIGTVQNVITPQEEGMTNTVSLEASGTNVRVRITPGAATATVWMGTLRRVRKRNN